MADVAVERDGQVGIVRLDRPEARNALSPQLMAELAQVCDMIVASETAEFGQPEITLGIIPGGGGTQRLARVLGKQRAMELVLTGRRIEAKEALQLGIVNMVTPKRK